MILSPLEFVIFGVIAVAFFGVRIPQILRDNGFYAAAASAQYHGLQNVWYGLIMVWSIAVCMALIRAVSH